MDRSGPGWPRLAGARGAEDKEHPRGPRLVAARGLACMQTTCARRGRSQAIDRRYDGCCASSSPEISGLASLLALTSGHDVDRDVDLRKLRNEGFQTR